MRVLSFGRSLERRSADLCERLDFLARACAEIQAAEALKELLAVVPTNPREPRDKSASEGGRQVCKAPVTVGSKTVEKTLY